LRTPPRAFDQVAGRRVRRQVVNDGAAVSTRQQLAGRAQDSGSSARVSSIGGQCNPMD
jgi:hypothetical protein